jgi:hypothetical protein
MKIFMLDDLIAVLMAMLLAGTLAAATVGVRATAVPLLKTPPTFASLTRDKLALRESYDDYDLSAMADVRILEPARVTRMDGVTATPPADPACRILP